MNEEYMRKIEKNRFLKTYPINGSREEKLKSELLQDLGDSASVFKLLDESKTAMIFAAQTYGKSNVDNIRYITISGNMVIDPVLVNKGTPWNEANSLHYEFRNVNDDDKIMIADIIYNGRGTISTISKQEIIDAAWNLIDNYGIPQNAFKYMQNKTK